MLPKPEHLHAWPLLHASTMPYHGHTPPYDYRMHMVTGNQGGLGWHMHGRTWLGLVYGRKRWHVYAPGNATPHARSHPLYDAEQWVRVVLPTLPADQQPLQCTQVGGEVMYLPPAWAHLTLNDGAAIGFGAQGLWEVDDMPALKVAAGAGDPEANRILGEMTDDDDGHKLLKVAADWHPLAVGEKWAHLQQVCS